ncbi:MAG TPA: membrane protein insertion efficiency factor YidD [bacterium]|nr:membrane protein insertion efficiency factor YidD [bacterium]
MIARLLIWCIHGYRRTLGAVLPPTCRFEPTCSRYAEGALREHGAFKGVMLACWRLLRCNPLGEYGHDPVPPRGRAATALRRRVVAGAGKELPYTPPGQGDRAPTTTSSDDQGITTPTP